MKMKAAIYTRVSTQGQAVNGESLDMQKERLVAYVNLHKWKLFKIYEDGGFSGKDTNRPAFQRILRDAEQERFDVLVVYKIDRLSRSILDFHKTMEFLNKHKISFVSVTQQFDTTTSMGRLMLAILVDFANFEREIDADRAFDAYMNRLKNGVPSGAIPYGYKRENKKIVILPEKAKIVKEIFNLAKSGHSTRQIAKEIGFTHHHIRSILDNPFYAGYLVRRRDKYNHRIPPEQYVFYKAQHEPIISLELWKAVFNTRKHNVRIRKSKWGSLFSRLIYCPYCKHNLSFHAKQRKSGIVVFYYECDPIRPGEKSCHQYGREEPLEEELLKRVTRRFRIRATKEKQTANNQKKTAQITLKIKRLIRLAENDDLPLEEVKRRIKELNKEKASLLASQVIKDDFKEVRKVITKISQVYPYMTREEKSMLWHAVIEQIVAYRERFVVMWRDGGKSYIKRGEKLKIPLNQVQPLSPPPYLGRRG